MQDSDFFFFQYIHKVVQLLSQIPGYFLSSVVCLFCFWGKTKQCSGIILTLLILGGHRICQGLYVILVIEPRLFLCMVSALLAVLSLLLQLLVFGAHLAVLRAYFWLRAQSGSVISFQCNQSWEPYRVLGMETGSIVCKTSILSAVLSWVSIPYFHE